MTVACCLSRLMIRLLIDKMGRMCCLMLFVALVHDAAYSFLAPQHVHHDQTKQVQTRVARVQVLLLCMMV